MSWLVNSYSPRSHQKTIGFQGEQKLIKSLKFTKACHKLKTHRFLFIFWIIYHFLFKNFKNIFTVYIYHTTNSTLFGMFRNIHRRSSVKKIVPKNFAIFTGKHLCWSLFLINLQAFRSTALLKRDSNTGVFLWILRNFKNTYLEEHLRTVASKCWT